MTDPTKEHHDAPPAEFDEAVAARVAAGFACARCGGEDGPMRDASFDNVRFVHTHPCTGREGPVRAFTMQPQGRPDPAGRPATSLDALEARADAIDERGGYVAELAARQGPVSGATASAHVDAPTSGDRLEVLKAALDDAEANLARVNTVLADPDDDIDVDLWSRVRDEYVTAFDAMVDGGIRDGFMERVARVDAAIWAMKDLLAGRAGDR